MAVNTSFRGKNISIMLFVALLVSAGYYCVFTTRIGSREIYMISSSVLLGVCLFGALFLLAESGGIRSRRIFALQMLSAGIVTGFLVVRILLRNDAAAVPVRDFSPAIVVWGNIYSFILLGYPFEMLCTSRMTFGKYFKLFLSALLTGLLSYGFIRLPGHQAAGEWFRFTVFVYPSWLFLIILRQRKRYIVRIRKNFSDADNAGPGWLDYYLFGYLLILVSYMIVVLTHNQQSLLMLIFCFLLFFGFSFYHILRQQMPDLLAFSVEDHAVGTLDNGVVSGSGQTDLRMPGTTDNKYRFEDKIPEYKVMLDRWIQMEKPYLNKDFKLLDVMQVLPLNRSYLSRMFNEVYGETFFCFVMRYRIEESARMLTARPDLTVACIAQACGFSSASVFSRAFLRNTGMTPKEYRNSKLSAE